ncbi:MAG TPA: ABC transporter ATP-binding protein [Candidatus Choladousia intestinigallinarum]|nr:ABC transporter ATP-binding protein [Candidatus Choladousia intestinigallinarum]
MSILEVRGLVKTYGEGEAKVQALRGIDLSVERGEFVAVVGSSGSGKSTFLNLVGGLDLPTAGEVIVDGKNLQSLSDREITIFRRRKIGFIFQQYNLIPMLNARENILLPLKLDGREGDGEYLRELVHMLGLEDKLHALPGQLSGGQQQRVAIARALAAKPSLLLADEPTGNLDSKTSQDVTGLLRITGERFRQTIIMITHNEEIAQSADRILRIEDGRLAG